MKRRNLWWLVAGLAFSAPALAEVKIGYVDVRAVLLESKTGIQFRADMQKLQKDKETSLRKEDEKLKSLQQTFEKEALTLSEAQKLEKQKAFQEKVQVAQKMMADAQNEVRQKEQDYVNKSRETIRQIIAEVAKQEKVSLVIGEILYAEDGMDLTAKVTQKFDSRSTKK